MRSATVPTPASLSFPTPPPQGGHTTEMLRVAQSFHVLGPANMSLRPLVFVAAESDEMSETKLRQVPSLKQVGSGTCGGLRPAQTEDFHFINLGVYVSHQAHTSHAAPQTTLERIPRSREVGQSYVSSVFSTLRATAACWPLLRKHRPEMVRAMARSEWRSCGSGQSQAFFPALARQDATPPALPSLASSAAQPPFLPSARLSSLSTDRAPASPCASWLLWPGSLGYSARPLSTLRAFAACPHSRSRPGS
jgi:hypothetical protein